MTTPNTNHPQLTVVAPSSGPIVDELHSTVFELGVAGAKKDCVWLLPTTVGLTHRVAQGAKSVDGMVVGVSPAESRLVHDNKYRLPRANYDSIIYCGQPLQARDHTLLASADAVIFIGDKAASPQLFALAVEAERPIGVLLSSVSEQWYRQFSETLSDTIGETGHPLFEQDPKKLIARLVKQLS